MARLSTPASLEELKGLLACEGTRLVAGGTDWFVREAREPSDALFSTLVDLSGVPELRGVALEAREGENILRIGAGETMTALAQDPLVRALALCLAEAAACVGSWQIRNRATLGGNLAGGSPAADTPPALCALGASAVVLSPRGTREVPVTELVGRAAKGGRVLAPDEALAAFLVPSVPGRVSAFGKVGSRREVTIARLNLAVSARFDGTRFTEARVFLGTLGSPGRRAPEAESALGTGDPEARARTFLEALAGAVDAAIPGRSTRPYKRSVVRALGEDVLEALLKRTEGVRS